MSFSFGWEEYKIYFRKKIEPLRILIPKPDNTTEPPVTTTVTTSALTLPQTGYSKTYAVIVFAAALLTFTGTVIVVKSRRKDE